MDEYNRDDLSRLKLEIRELEQYAFTLTDFIITKPRWSFNRRSTPDVSEKAIRTKRSLLKVKFDAGDENSTNYIILCGLVCR